MSPEPSPKTRMPRDEDEIVTALSYWLAFHLGNAELRQRLLAIGTDGLSDDQASAVKELLGELEHAPEDTRGPLEMLVRETLEAVALG